jgi:alpha-tubulin suppressor-like RCC1 family protein
LYCFGDNEDDQLGFNEETDVKLMALSDFATCIVKNSALNEVVCKGESSFNDKTYSMGEEIVKLVSGEEHFCVLLKSNKAKCFGRNSDGQLGNGSTIDSYDAPVDVLASEGGSPISDITDINAGYSSTCLVVSNNTPMCFGHNEFYVLGIANEGEFGGADVFVPTELDVDLPTNRGNIISIHVGSTGHVVYSDNSVFSWGDNDFGTLGDGSDTSTVIGDTDNEEAVQMNFDWN